MRKKSFCFFVMVFTLLSVGANVFCAEAGKTMDAKGISNSIADLQYRLADKKISRQDECSCRLQLLDLQKKQYIGNKAQQISNNTDLIVSYFKNAKFIEKNCTGNMGVPYNRYDLVVGSGCFNQMQDDLLNEYNYIVKCKIENPDQPSACYFYLRHEDTLEAFKDAMPPETRTRFDVIKKNSR